MTADAPPHEVFYLTTTYSQNVPAPRDHACLMQTKVILYWCHYLKLLDVHSAFFWSSNQWIYNLIPWWDLLFLRTSPSPALTWVCSTLLLLPAEMPTCPPTTKAFEQNQPPSETILRDSTELKMQPSSSIKVSNMHFSKPSHEVTADLNCILHTTEVPDVFFSL